MNRPARIVLRVVCASLALVAFWFVLTEVIMGMPGRLNFSLHRSRYEEMITAAKRLEIPPNSHKDFNIAGMPVSVIRGPSGSYVITFITRDWNHAGIYGYIYTDDLLEPIDSEFSGEREFPVSGSTPLFVRSRISGHWWTGCDPTH
jgi:hypothetical protein